ncbi:MAG: HK97 family phage prohead protease [Rhizobiaceae bacterium]
MSIKIRDFDLEIKAVERMAFSGYGSVFDVVDTYNEVVAAGAFTESLADRKAKNRPIPVLWQHRTDSPLASMRPSVKTRRAYMLKGAC